MNHAGSLDTLSEIVRRESSSLLHYIHDAYPWTLRRHVDDLAKLQRMIEQERGAVAGLAQLLIRHRVPPPRTGQYPTDFTSLNFIALEHLVPLLIDYEEKSIARLEQEMRPVAEPDLKAALETLLAQKKRNLDGLRKIQAPEPSVTA